VNHSLRTIERSFTPFAASVRILPRRRATGMPAVRRKDVGLVAVLVTRYPVICRLVGAESFQAMAHRFVAAGPPGFAADLDFWETFPRFLRSRGDTASIEYVADIAELEMACGKARRAGDARPVSVQEFAPLSIKRLKGLRVEFHPSVFLVASRFPIVTIWESNQRHGEPGMIARWRPEAALVARPFAEIEVRRLLPGGHAFIGALSEGQSVAAAVKAGQAAAGDFDVAANLMALIEARIVVGLRESA